MFSEACKKYYENSENFDKMYFDSKVAFRIKYYPDKEKLDSVFKVWVYFIFFSSQHVKQF